MKRTIAVTMVLLLLFAGCTAAKPAVADDLELISQTVDASAQISDDIEKIAQWQLDDSAAYEKQNDIYQKTGNESDKPKQTDPDEVKAKYNELTDLSDQIDALSAKLEDFKPNGKTGYDDTLKAANEYFTELKGAAGDMKAVFDYYFAMQDALKPFTDFTEVDSTTGVQDYALYAGQLSQVTSQSQKALADVECPQYMQDSHKLLMQRIDEFQAFCQDFSIAVQMGDPLRLMSSQYRINRLSIMLDECDKNLTDDFNLQFSQIIKRLNGRIETLRGELTNNTNTLLKAVER